ncbi:hypothetical protein EDC04DRAFT_2618676 [Pisolithus marmoratus]|nr:hypothetical protein EDC04DRAFT_2618676 [Pisolithus marmoratus]
MQRLQTHYRRASQTSRHPGLWMHTFLLVLNPVIALAFWDFTREPSAHFDWERMMALHIEHPIGKALPMGTDDCGTTNIFGRNIQEVLENGKEVVSLNEDLNRVTTHGARMYIFHLHGNITTSFVLPLQTSHCGFLSLWTIMKMIFTQSSVQQASCPGHLPANSTGRCGAAWEQSAVVHAHTNEMPRIIMGPSSTQVDLPSMFRMMPWINVKLNRVIRRLLTYMAGHLKVTICSEEVWVDLCQTKTALAHHSWAEVTAEQNLTAIMAEYTACMGEGGAVVRELNDEIDSTDACLVVLWDVPLVAQLELALGILAAITQTMLSDAFSY